MKDNIIIRSTAFVTPEDPWQKIYEAIYELYTRGVRHEHLKIYCSSLIQVELRALMADRVSGLSYESGMHFMGVPFSEYPYNTEILVFAEKACYYEELLIKIPIDIRTRIEVPKGFE